MLLGKLKMSLNAVLLNTGKTPFKLLAQRLKIYPPRRIYPDSFFPTKRVSEGFIDYTITASELLPSKYQTDRIWNCYQYNVTTKTAKN